MLNKFQSWHKASQSFFLVNIFKLVHKLYRATAQVSDMTDGSLVCLFWYMMNTCVYTQIQWTWWERFCRIIANITPKCGTIWHFSMLFWVSPRNQITAMENSSNGKKKFCLLFTFLAIHNVKKTNTSEIFLSCETPKNETFLSNDIQLLKASSLFHWQCRRCWYGRWGSST